MNLNDFVPLTLPGKTRGEQQSVLATNKKKIQIFTLMFVVLGDCTFVNIRAVQLHCIVNSMIVE